MHNCFSGNVDSRFIKSNVYVSNSCHLFSMSSWREANSMQGLFNTRVVGTDKERSSADGCSHRLNYDDFKVNGIE